MAAAARRAARAQGRPARWEWIPMADDKGLLDQDEIERLLKQSSAAGPAAPAPAGPAPSSPGDSDQLEQGEIEALLRGAATSAPAAAPGPPKSAAPAQSSGAESSASQDDIERLLSAGAKAPSPKRPSAPARTAAAPADDGSPALEDVEFLLRQAEQAINSIDSPSATAGARPFRFEEFAKAQASSENATLDLLSDVELDLTIELGRTHLYLEDVLKLRKGSVVPLDKLAGDPVDIYVNGRLVARGEVLVLNDNFCVRVAELIAGTQAAS